MSFYGGMKKRNSAAFSILEVVLFLAIIGLLAAAFVPASMRVKEKVREDMIGAQLGLIIAAGNKYMLEKDVSQVSYKALLQERLIQPAIPVDGEKYDDIVMKGEGGTITLKRAGGKEYSRTY